MYNVWQDFTVVFMLLFTYVSVWSCHTLCVVLCAELRRGEPGAKRKYDGDLVSENDVDKENKSPSEVTTDTDSAATDNDLATRAEVRHLSHSLVFVYIWKRDELNSWCISTK